MEKINSLLVLSLFAGLTACGGSGGGSDDASNNGANNNAGGSTAPVQADTQAPVITVNGDLAIELPFGALYDDDGASALDNVDGDVDVAKEGEVDTFTAGVYDINYTATDVAGNQSQAVRQVTVLGEKVLLQVSSVGQANYELANGTVLPCNDAGSLCSLELDFGETVSVIPNAGADWQFLRWEVCDEIVADQCQVVMTEDKLIAATHLPLAEPVYHDDVIFLTDAQITALVDYDENQNALIFAAGADIAEFQVGSVLVANGDNQFIRRVVDIIELTGAPTIIETAPASLDDVIESGTLIFDVQDESSKLEKNTDKADKKATQKAAQKIAQTTAQNSTASKTLSVPDVELASSADVSVSASGSMGADFQASILVDYSKDRGLTQARILGQAQLETSIGFSVVGEGSVAASQRLDLASFNVASITTPSSPVLIPLMFTVEVEPFVDMAVSGSFSAELSPSVTASLAGSVGAV